MTEADAHVLRSIWRAGSYSAWGEQGRFEWLEWGRESEAAEDLEELFALTFRSSEDLGPWLAPNVEHGPSAMPSPSCMGGIAASAFEQAYRRALDDFTDERDRATFLDERLPQLLAERSALTLHVERVQLGLQPVFARARNILKVWLAEAVANSEPGSWLQAPGVIRPAFDFSMFYRHLRTASDLLLSPPGLGGGPEPEGAGRGPWWKVLEAGRVPAALARAQQAGLMYCIRTRDAALVEVEPFEAKRWALEIIVPPAVLRRPIPLPTDIDFERDPATQQLREALSKPSARLAYIHSHFAEMGSSWQARWKTLRGWEVKLSMGPAYKDARTLSSAFNTWLRRR